MIIERFRSALLILSSSLLLAACQSPRQAETGRATVVNQNAATPKPAATPEANIFVDEPRLVKSYAVIGGTVQNVGGQKLERLSVLIDLRRRDDGTTVRREVAIEPADVEPGAQGKFAIKVEPDEFRGSSVVGLRSGAGARDVAFKSLPGAKRPAERLPDRVVDVKVPGKKSKGGDGEFINTPDTPIKVP
jgi:hypothetical protein